MHLSVAVPIRLGLVLAACTAAAAQTQVLATQGDSHGAEFGSVVVMLEDVNGDGKTDILVGCPEDDTVGEDAGAVHILSGADGSSIRTQYGAAEGDRFGAAADTLPDIDGDGRGEYAIGAPFADANGADAGRVQVFSGGTGTLMSTLKGVSAGDRFGSAVAFIGYTGTVLGGFHETLAIGAPYADGGGTNAGAVSFRSWDGTVSSDSPGVQANEHLGAVIDAAQDNLVAGAPDYDTTGGADFGRIQAWHIEDPGGGLVVTELFTRAGDADNEHFGTSVAVVNWIDSTPRFAAGAPGAATPTVRIAEFDGTPFSGGSKQVAVLTGSGGFGASITAVDPDLGASYVLIGSPDFVAGSSAVGRVSIYEGGSLFATVQGTEAGARFGAALGGQLGFPDSIFSGQRYLIGIPDADGVVADSGRIEVRTDTTFKLAVSAPPTSGDFTGGAVAGLGDVNADGVPDLLVGSPDDDKILFLPQVVETIDCGSARVLSGATGAVLRTHYGTGNGDRLGASVAALGDIDLDGVTDYVTGAPQTATATISTGYAKAWSGASGALLFTYDGVANGSAFGAAVGGGSDLNGDGRPDILIGAPDSFNGSVWSFSGVNGAQLGVVSGAAMGDRFGAAVAGLGADADGDGKQDWIAGAPNANFLSTADAGTAYLMKSISSLSIVNSVSGFAANDHCGAAVAAAGDVNLDGKVDWIVGIPGYDAGAVDTGRARIMSGTGVIAQQLNSINGDGLNDEFGSSVAALGDVNHDGWPDWAAGAWESSFGFVGSGYVKVISGKDEALLFKISGAPGDGLGYAVAGAGDINLDGTRDLFAGGPSNDNKGEDSGLASVYSLVTGLPVWTNLGFALAGSQGTPTLSGAGSLAVGSPGALTLMNAAPSALAYLFVSLASTPTPFKGGTLVPVPPLLTLIAATDFAGGIILPWSAWPAGLSGLDFYFQFAVKDAAAVHGTSLSNALRADVP